MKCDIWTQIMLSIKAEYSGDRGINAGNLGLPVRVHAHSEHQELDPTHFLQHFERFEYWIGVLGSECLKRALCIALP